jgi:hypothetical protein
MPHRITWLSVGWLLGLAALTVLAYAAIRSRTADAGNVAPAHSSEPVILVSGLDARSSEHFFLAAGSYHGMWSAWGQTPADPPCTHSVALVTDDGTDVVELAESIQVPSTGTTGQIDIPNLKSGEYYLRINSACGWQVQLSPFE